MIDEIRIILYKKRYESDIDMLINLLPDAEKHGIEINIDIIKSQKIFTEKDDDFFYSLADAIFKTEIIGTYDLVDGDITEEDIRKAVELYGDEFGISNKILPVLWDKEYLWRRCAEFSYGYFQDTIHFFTELYRGKDDEAVIEFLFSKF